MHRSLFSHPTTLSEICVLEHRPQAVWSVATSGTECSMLQNMDVNQVGVGMDCKPWFRRVFLRRKVESLVEKPSWSVISEY